VVFIVFYIYGRKSIYTGKGESIENQIDMCKKYIFEKFADVSSENIHIYEDEGFSAKDTNRPNFKRMMRDIKINRPNFLLCYRLDRISRCVSDFSLLVEELNRINVAFVCIKEEFDTSKPMGKAMMYIASVFAQLERETIAERVKDNMLLLAKKGIWLGGNTPYGYTSFKEKTIMPDGKTKAFYELSERAEEVNIVKKIYDKFLKHKNINQVKDFLITCNYKNRNDKYFSNTQIKSILQNPVYCAADFVAYEHFKRLGFDVCFDPTKSQGCGIFSYNKRDYRKDGAPKRKTNEIIIASGNHKPIICGKKWIHIQNILTESSRKRNIKEKTYLLSGIAFCKKCGSKMFAKKRYNDPEKFDYICNKKLLYGKDACNMANFCGLETDAAVLSALSFIKIKASMLSDISSRRCIDENSCFFLTTEDKKRILKRLNIKILLDDDKINIFLP